MNLFKQVKNKKSYLNKRNIQESLEEIMFCASCERPFKVGDYNVKLKLKKSKFYEIITCPNPDCEGDTDFWITPESAIDILQEVYKKEQYEMSVPEMVYYNSLIKLMNIISEKSDCSKIEKILDDFKKM
jgi:hypothetical protein